MKTLTVEGAYLSGNDSIWDSYVARHPKARCYHLSSWLKAIRKSYGHRVYQLVALQSDESPLPADSSDSWASPADVDRTPRLETPVVGVLPLVHLKHFLFGNALISTAFSDYGGILGDNEEAEQSLLQEAVKLGQKLGANHIELRQVEPLSWIGNPGRLNSIPSSDPPVQSDPPVPLCATQSHKVSVFLELPDSSEALMDSFKSKLRSQIKKPMKEGLEARIGGLELLNDFYKVFTINMKYLGSPVHSKKLMQNILVEFKENAKVVVVYQGKRPLAAGLIVGFRKTLVNPWASSLREFSRLSPNMLLYWAMLDFACTNGFKYFDFGRSSPDEGTYKFKTQWGSKAVGLNWHRIALTGQSIEAKTGDKERFGGLIELWKRLPLYVTRILGPPIRKHIGL